MHYGIDHDISIGFYNNFKVFFNYELNYLGPCHVNAFRLELEFQADLLSQLSLAQILYKNI